MRDEDVESGVVGVRSESVFIVRTAGSLYVTRENEDAACFF